MCSVGLLAGATVGCATSDGTCDLHSCDLATRPAHPPFLASRDLSSAVAAGHGAEHRVGAVAVSVRHGEVDCFEAGRHREEEGKTHKLAYCEGSAIVYDGEHLFMASDKPIPGATSSVFELRRDNGRMSRRPSHYLSGGPLQIARKIEDASVTPDGERVFLSTGFDRIMPGRDSWDGYNVLMSYPVGRPEALSVVGLEGDAEGPTSVAFREHLGAQLPTAAFPEGAPYFKVEGLAAGPDHRLLMGIRELGASYRTFDYSLIIVEARWSEDAAGRVHVDPSSFRTAYRVDDLSVSGHKVGLSSLEYDPHRDRYLMLVSYEYEGRIGGRDEETLGGFMMVLTPDDLAEQSLPRLVVSENGAPLHFVNKPEGLTFLAEDRVLISFDDDRVLDCGDASHRHHRQPHQTALGLVELAPPSPRDETSMAAVSGGEAAVPLR